MRNASFWQDAAKSLPAPVQQRYAAYFESAERFDETLAIVLAAGSRVKKALSGLFAAPAPRAHH
jgi:hypothetical protein